MDQHFQTAPLDQNLPVILAGKKKKIRKLCGVFFHLHSLLVLHSSSPSVGCLVQQFFRRSNARHLTLRSVYAPIPRLFPTGE